jgi:hypothetical protein
MFYQRRGLILTQASTTGKYGSSTMAILYLEGDGRDSFWCQKPKSENSETKENKTNSSILFYTMILFNVILGYFSIKFHTFIDF